MEVQLVGKSFWFGGDLRSASLLFADDVFMLALLDFDHQDALESSAVKYKAWSQHLQI